MDRVIIKKAGVWSLPYSPDKARKIVSLLNRIGERGPFFYIKDYLHEVLGNDRLYDEFIKINDKTNIEGKLVQAIKDDIKYFLDAWAHHPEEFKGEFHPEAIQILQSVFDKEDTALFAENINVLDPEAPDGDQDSEEGSNLNKMLRRKKKRFYNEPGGIGEQMNEGVQEERNKFTGPGTENSYGGPFGGGRPAGW